MVETSKILGIISDQFAKIINGDLDFFGSIKLIIQEEQMFLSDEKEDENNAIYIVVKFLPATIDYSQTAIPITFNCISEYNNLEIARTLLFKYSETYNLLGIDNDSIQQVWETPSIASNFVEMYEGFRSLLQVAGAMLFTDNGNSCTLEYFPSLKINKLSYLNYDSGTNDFFEDENRTISFNENAFIKVLNEQGIVIKEEDEIYFENKGNYWALFINGEDKTIIKDGEKLSIFDYGVSFNLFSNKGDKIDCELKNDYMEIECISLNTATSIQLDSQAFYRNNNFTQSVGKFGSFSINVTTYLFDNEFLNKCLAVYLGETDKEPRGIDTEFDFRIKFRNNHQFQRKMKLQSFALEQEKGVLPIVSITFSE